MQTSSFFALVYTDVGSSDVGNTSTKDINLTNRSNEDGAICYMQLRKELFERLPEFEETVTKAIAKPKQVFAQLRDSFGKEIMLVEV
jgi:predicted ester cyclase